MSSVQTILKLFDTANPTPGQCDEVVGIIRRYPYFTAAAAVAVSRCSSGIDTLVLNKLMNRAALGASDRLAFYRFIEPSAMSHAAFYPPRETPKVTTESAIDTFLDTYGAPIPPEEQAMLEKLIFNPAADYSSILQREQGGEAPAVSDRQDELLDAFLAKTSGRFKTSGVSPDDFPALAAPSGISDGDSGGGNDKENAGGTVTTHGGDSRAVPPVQPPSASLLSESLARIYVKRGRYDKAYEIIHNLSLNFPEKSIYFADQLRFLQKLMVNSKYSNPQK